MVQFSLGVLLSSHNRPKSIVCHRRTRLLLLPLLQCLWAGRKGGRRSRMRSRRFLVEPCAPLVGDYFFLLGDSFWTEELTYHALNTVQGAEEEEEEK